MFYIDHKILRFTLFTLVRDIIEIDSISDISSNASNDTSNKQNKETTVNKCTYQLSTMNDIQCQNVAIHKCSHCSFLYCLEHSSQHRDDLEEEINYLLDEAQVS